MKPKFYDALQMDPGILKRKITTCHTVWEKAYYWLAIAVRSLLIVAFAILFINLLSSIFGSENTPFAVALFCIMLGIRFVNFEYCIGDSLITLAASLCILILIPSVAAVIPSFFLIPLHFVSFFSLLYMTTQKPEMGNGGLYGFAYIYLTGNPVTGDALIRRILLGLTVYLICGAILFFKHRNQHKTVRFHHVIQKFDLSSLTQLWQLRVALGTSLILSLGQIFHMERFMWMGFACASLLSEYPYSDNTSLRFRQRIWGVLAGSCIFYILYLILPANIQPLLGPLGGLCLGFCTDYRYKTAMNCLGALMLGTGLYGLHGAIILRIINTALGVIFGALFAAIFHRLVVLKIRPAVENP